MIDFRRLVPASSLVGSLVRLPLRLIPDDAALRVKGGVNKGYRWIAGSGAHTYWIGIYESEKQRTLRRLVRPGMQVLDLGANVGFYTLAFSRLVGPTGQVWAFEPASENLRYLRSHVELNALANVTVVAAAVGSVTGFSMFDPGPASSMGKLHRRGSVRVRVVTLDQLIAAREIATPDVIKVDIEGGEAEMLRGAKRLLESGHTTWLIALHGARASEEVREVLSDFSYQVELLDGTPTRPGEPLQSDEIVARRPKPTCSKGLSGP